jgi:hypothetical protein
MIIPGDTQPKRGEPIPKGLLTDVNVYIKWYNGRPNRAKCSYCGAMVEVVKTETELGMCLDLKHKPTCDTLTEI